MKHLDFWSRMASLAIAMIALGVYQAHAFQWQEAMEANQKEIAEANAQIAGASGAVTYLDGVYIGEGEGFGGTITVQVTVNDGKITFIEITDASNEDAAYLDKAEQIIDNIITAQTPEVDTISGAT
ncbi:MAG: FMN-binding protein, partial [Clostridia bacterium]|nr:FMN-binding protein [Clostridia bacterium]